MESPEKLIVEINAGIQELNRLGRQFDGIGEIVARSSVLAPQNFGSREFSFFRTVSWVYVLFFETGRIGVRYLAEYLAKAHIADGASLRGTLDLVQSLRTLLQHNLDGETRRDLQIEQGCGVWFAKCCRTSVPATEDDWSQCLHQLLSQSKDAIRSLVRALRQIEAHDARAELLDAWRFRKARYKAPHEFDVVIESAANDLGRSGIDVLRFRGRHFDRWSHLLAAFGDDADVALEIRRMVEYALIAEDVIAIPVTGADVMQYFQIAPGRLVGEILKEARTMYLATPCNKDELLLRLTTSPVVAGLIAASPAASRS